MKDLIIQQSSFEKIGHLHGGFTKTPQVLPLQKGFNAKEYLIWQLTSVDRAHGHSRNIVLLRKFRRPRAPLQVHWSGFKLSPWKAFYFYSRGSDGPLFGYTSSWDIEPHAGPSANPLILYLGMWTI